MYVLINLKTGDIGNKIIVSAITNTFTKRGTILYVEEFNMIIEDLYNDKNIRKLWIEYQYRNGYAKDIEYVDTINAIKQIISILENETVKN